METIEVSILILWEKNKENPVKKVRQKIELKRALSLLQSVIEMLGWRLKELDKGNIKLLSYCHHYQTNSGWRPGDILSLEQCNLNISRGWEQYNSYLLAPIIHQRFPYFYRLSSNGVSMSQILLEATLLARWKNSCYDHFSVKSLGHQSFFIVK